MPSKHAFSLVELPVVRQGFTMIELLIVIAIVVLLLSLLVVGINKSIYEAELAACGARLKSLTQSTQLYAFDFERRYPIPPQGRIFMLNVPYDGQPDSEPYNLLPVVKGRIPFEMFLCPLTEEISIAPEDNFMTGVWTSYVTWSGWQYSYQDERKEAGMFRIGDRWGWRGRRYVWLASDLDLISNTGRGTYGSHPDRDRNMQSEKRQNDPVVGLDNYFATWTRWTIPSGVTQERSEIDMNSAADDGSVTRLRNLAVRDERQVEVQHQPVDIEQWLYRVYVPAR